MPDDPMAALCPACAGASVHWSVRRWHREGKSALRYFAWECLSCGETWAEPIVLADPVIEATREGSEVSRDSHARGR
jgi:hypothetical protein